MLQNQGKRWKRFVRFGDSKEGEVEEYYSTRRGNGKICTRGKNRNSTPWDQEIINELDAEDNLRWLINTNFNPGDLHMALTYRKGARPTMEESLKLVQKFLRDMRAYYKKLEKPFKYIWSTELGEHGAIHHHFVVEYTDIRILQKYWPHGKVRIMGMLDNTKRYDALANYIIKNGRKAFYSDKFPNKKRFNSSKNLDKPIIEYENIKAKRWKQPPKSNKKYFVVPGSLEQGIHGRTATPWRKYKVIFLE